MIVRQYKTVFINDEAGSKAPLPVFFGNLVLKESLKPVMKRIILTKREPENPAPFNNLHRTDVDHGLPRLLHQL